MVERNHLVIWRLQLDYQSGELNQYKSLLSSSELIKSEKFHFDKDRNRFIISHGVLRKILSTYTGLRPEEIKISENRYGKPFVQPGTADNDIRFNISHSHRGVLLAFSSGIELGVDLEFQRSDFPTLDIVKRFFSEREIADFLSVAVSDRVQAFYNCWTRKEAYIKARGMGLSIPLESFDVSLIPGQPAELRKAPDDGIAGEWRVMDLNVWGGYSGAICIEKEVVSIKVQDWE